MGLEMGIKGIGTKMGWYLWAVAGAILVIGFIRGSIENVNAPLVLGLFVGGLAFIIYGSLMGESLGVSDEYLAMVRGFYVAPHTGVLEYDDGSGTEVPVAAGAGCLLCLVGFLSMVIPILGLLVWPWNALIALGLIFTGLAIVTVEILSCQMGRVASPIVASSLVLMAIPIILFLIYKAPIAFKGWIVIGLLGMGALALVAMASHGSRHASGGEPGGEL